MSENSSPLSLNLVFVEMIASPSFLELSQCKKSKMGVLPVRHVRDSLMLRSS